MRTNVPSLAVITMHMVGTATRTMCEPLARAKTRECTERAVITLHSFADCLCCSSIWVYGHGVRVPTTEADRPSAIDEAEPHR